MIMVVQFSIVIEGRVISLRVIVRARVPVGFGVPAVVKIREGTAREDVIREASVGGEGVVEVVVGGWERAFFFDGAVGVKKELLGLVMWRRVVVGWGRRRGVDGAVGERRRRRWRQSGQRRRRRREMVRVVVMMRLRSQRSISCAVLLGLMLMVVVVVMVVDEVGVVVIHKWW